MALPRLFHLCSPVQVLGGNEGTGQEAQSTQVSLEMAVPTPHSLAFPELLPARDSFLASLNPAAISSWRQGVVAQLYLCLPSTPCQGHPAFLPGLGRVTVQLLGKTISSYLAVWEGWHEDVLGSVDLRPTPHTVSPQEASQINVIK